MTLLLSLLLAAVSTQYQTLPLLQSPAYISHDALRAEQAVPVETQNRPPQKIDVVSLGPVLSAQSALVVDAASGAVLFEKDAHNVRPLASIVKLMTALVFLESEPDLTQRLVMEETDDREGGDDFIRPGESATLEDYLRASLLGSANNATIVLSRNAGVSSKVFIERMNTRAQELGMKDTVFVEPTGLDPDNVSTARDITQLLHAVRTQERITEITGLSQSSIRVYPRGVVRRVFTTNHLLGSIIFVEYGKTGYLDEALYNLATTVSTRLGNEMYIIVFGSETNEDRVQDAKNLAYWTAQTYSWK